MWCCTPAQFVRLSHSDADHLHNRPLPSFRWFVPPCSSFFSYVCSRFVKHEAFAGFSFCFHFSFQPYTHRRQTTNTHTCMFVFALNHLVHLSIMYHKPCCPNLILLLCLLVWRNQSKVFYPPPLLPLHQPYSLITIGREKKKIPFPIIYLRLSPPPALQLSVPPFPPSLLAFYIYPKIFSPFVPLTPTPTHITPYFPIGSISSPSVFPFLFPLQFPPPCRSPLPFYQDFPIQNPPCYRGNPQTLAKQNLFMYET